MLRSLSRLRLSSSQLCGSTAFGVLPVLDLVRGSSASAVHIAPSSHFNLKDLEDAEATMALFKTASKSTKRKAAEALLHSRYHAPDSSNHSTQDAGKRRQVTASAHVAACPEARHASSFETVSDWCSFGVSLAHINWSALASAHVQECDDDTVSDSDGQSLPTYQLPQGITVYVVSRSLQVPQALRLLKASMQDSLISIDLEWKPDRTKDISRVALMQLSSATCCVLLRSCKMGYHLPDELLAFFRNPQHRFLGYAWDSADEKKMHSTFGLGKADLFCNFLDLQVIAAALGYSGTGLARLTEMVLGCVSHKSRKVVMSNWEARSLDDKQLQYAALDALLTGQVFRGLRLWHSAPCSCSTCLQPLGVIPPKPIYLCTFPGCNERFVHFTQLEGHAKKMVHGVSVIRCRECGRLHQKQALQPS